MSKSQERPCVVRSSTAREVYFISSKVTYRAATISNTVAGDGMSFADRAAAPALDDQAEDELLAKPPNPPPIGAHWKRRVDSKAGCVRARAALPAGVARIAATRELTRAL